jgi:uncharacterized protein
MSDADNFVEFTIRGIGVDPESNTPVLMLQDHSARLLLPIWIGPLEAGAILSALEGRAPPRPMTHDLLVRLMTALDARVTRVDVRSLEGGTFYADLHLETGGGESVVVDCRPSDAIALAVRVDAPVRVEAEVLRVAHPLPTKENTESPDNAVSADDEEARARLVEQLAEMTPDEFGEYET